jgi:hypothetical protein
MNDVLPESHGHLKVGKLTVARAIPLLPVKLFDWFIFTSEVCQLADKNSESGQN